ncbi:putative structural component HK97 gp of phage origin [Escherichia coli]|nr:putative structural component HK97 gp of phage origin [Escherichia coli]
MIETLLDFSGLEDISRDLQLLSGAENTGCCVRQPVRVRMC